MEMSFNYFGIPEEPVFILCNPNFEQLYSLSLVLNKKYQPRYNALSEISFDADYMVDGTEVDYFDYLTYRRIIYFAGVGHFMISDIEESNNGKERSKRIIAKSLEIEFILKDIASFNGTYKFYDPITPAPTLIGKILNYLPGWSVGDIDIDLALLYRTFDNYNGTIYDFLMTEVEEAFQNVFVFDTINKTISAHTIENATTATDIFISFDNLLENVSTKEITDEITTALNVYGGGDLSINQVNPLGTDTIYDFTYYRSTEWMTQGLVDAIDAWETIVDNNQASYASLLTSLLTYNGILITQNSELVTLQSEKTALEGVLSVRIQQRLSLTSVKAEITAKQVEIIAKNVEIAATETSVASINSQLVVINTAVSFTTNFTDSQLTELSPFIVGNTYQNNNFIQTDSMSLVEIQEMAQKLYDQSIAILGKVSQPRYEFSIDAVNFLMLEEFAAFTSQLEMGSTVTLELEEGVYIYPALLGFDLDYENPNDFKLIFGNRLRLDDSSYAYSDLFNSTVQSSIRSGFESLQWSNFETNYKDDVSTFMDSALDTALNNIVSGSSQNILIDENGLRIRKSSGVDTYEDQQIWMNNGIIGFTDDNWDTASLALGAIEAPDGSTVYGLVAEVVMGNLVASNQLTIANENNTFIVDGSGATLTDATFTIESENNAKIILSPDEGISIYKKVPEGDGWQKNFYIDTNGNIIFTGNLSGASGTFTGEITASSGKIGAWTIDQYGLKDDSGNYIYGNGKTRLGALHIDGNVATFYGDIYANNLQGYVYGNQIKEINADEITAGTIKGIDIYGTNIYWPGVAMYSPGYGFSLIETSSNLTLRNSGINNAFSEITLASDGIFISTIGGELSIGNFHEPGLTKIGLYGEIYINYKKGITGTYLI